MLRKSFAKARLFVILTHAIGWILFLSLPVIFLTGNNDSAEIKNFLFSLPYWLYVFLYAFIFYFHNFFLLPRLYYRQNKWFYFLIVAALGMSVLMIQPFDRVMRISRPAASISNTLPHPDFHPPAPPQPAHGTDKRPQPPPNPEAMPFPRQPSFVPPFIAHVDIISLFLYLLLIAMGVLIAGSKKLHQVQEQLLKSESEKSRAELSFLKAQIHPHFIFNTLNNLYYLASVEHKETPEAILKLSGIMRYIIDNIDNTWVPLIDEIFCINDYIFLQRLRLGKTTHLTYTVEGDFEGKRMAPLLLISFIENVFKYGISKYEQSPLIISLTMENDTLLFKTENRIFKDRNTRGNGLGIANTKKRLDLMYAGHYQLETDDTHDVFTVKLALELKPL